MSLSFPTYQLSKKYTDETVVGGGAIKGKNLVVTSIESITDGKRINVQWTLDDGTVQTDHVDLENGEDGKGIKSVAINAEEHLIITYTDDTTSDAGKIEIQSAVDSVNGETGNVVLEITDIVNVGSNLTYNAQTKTLSADAQAQVQADWEQSDNTQADYIKNKPSLGTASKKDAINTVLAGSTSLPTGDAVKTAIDNAVSSAYHHAGTKTVAELTSALLVEANDGNVYNMTDSGVTTADFIEGAGKPIAIGDNVGVAKVGNDYKFDLLSGFIDTSSFVEKSSTSGLIKNDGTIDETAYAKQSEMSITDGTGADLGTSTIQLKSGMSKKVLTEHQDVTGKADKVQNATNNHIALLDGLGNLKDGGKAITDIVPAGGTTGQVLAKHSNTDGDVEWTDVQSGDANLEKATYEESSALYNHAVNELIVMESNNVKTLYKVTNTITAGDTITDEGQNANITSNTGIGADTQVYVSGLPSGEEIKLVAWDTGTEEEIAAMIEGYYNGDLTLADIQSVWSVGDMRTVSLSAMSATGVGESHRAQDVQMVILDFDHDTLTTPINEKTKALITVQQKDCLMDAGSAAGQRYNENNTEAGYMNPAPDTNVGGWRDCARRTWCNSIYFSALPLAFKSLIKNTEHVATLGNSTSNTTTTTDNVFLVSAYEVLGSNGYASAQEGTQYSYYTTVSNRNKNPSQSSQYTTSCTWWWRSTNNSNTRFCDWYGDGSSDYRDASTAYGIVPAMCL